MKTSIIALAVIAALSVGTSLTRSTSAAAPEILVVVNKSCSVSSLNKAQLNALFRSRTSEFPGGSPASVVNLPQDNPLRRDFDQAVLGMNPDEVQRYWIDVKIRSGTTPPRKMGSSAVVAKFVSSDAKGLGYVAAQDQHGLKVIARIRGGAVTGP